MNPPPIKLLIHEDKFNAEEAAHAATEFVSSLDNLPGEVSFLLQEITEKDTRITNLIDRIQKRHQALVKHGRSLASSTPSTPNGTTHASFTLPLPPGTPLPTDHLSTKDAQGLNKIQMEWAKIETLQDEKIKLAERMERIVSRARERGRAEWKKVGGMDLEEVESAVKGFEMGSGEVLLPPGGLGSGTDGRPLKKRKPNALPLPLPNHAFPIIHPPTSTPSSNAMLPPPPPSRPAFSARSSASSGRHHQHHPRGSSRSDRHFSQSTYSDPDADGEVDAEGEADDGDGEAGDGETDNRPYCTCHSPSYGEMIGCDNEDCEIEWFHITCVNVKLPMPETWYCPDCVRKLGFSTSDGQIAGKREKKARRR